MENLLHSYCHVKPMNFQPDLSIEQSVDVPDDLIYVKRWVECYIISPMGLKGVKNMISTSLGNRTGRATEIS